MQHLKFPMKTHQNQSQPVDEINDTSGFLRCCLRQEGWSSLRLILTLAQARGESLNFARLIKR
jgi:hypothetical protein